MDEARYDDFAAYYDEFVESSIYGDDILPTLWSFIPAVAGRRICDVACGQGVVSRGLAERGASVVGVDLSEKLLDLARQYETERPLGIEYRLEDAQTLSSLPDSSFEAATCNMALMDIPNAAAVFRSVARILVPHGWFALSITHPCWEAPCARWSETEDGTPIRIVSRYHTEGFWRAGNPEGLRYRVGAQHRTLSTYVNALADAGFTLERMLEPTGSQPRLQIVPGNREIPSLLFIRARK